MHRMTHSAIVGALALGLFASPSIASARSLVQSAPPADNSKVNKQPGDTADQQSNAKTDLEVTKRIRQELLKDKSLSSYAHNTKVITEGGAVTLRGPVRSSAEKKLVEDIAVRVAGAGNVTNQLTIKPAKK
jgi:hyperosmotically inducible protein